MYVSIIPLILFQLAEPDLIACAIRESESTHLEEAMLRDKLAETEQDAINRCIEDQAVRESYFDYFNQISVPVCFNTIIDIWYTCSQCVLFLSSCLSSFS